MLFRSNLNKVTGIEALRFSLLEAAIGVLLVVAIARRVHGDRIDEPTGTRTPRHPMRGSWALMLGAIVALEMWGLARHGDFKNSLWQFRQLIWMPALGVLFGYSLKSAASRVALVRIVLAVACVRALLGIWFHFAICVPQDIVTEYATTHSDAILATVAILLGLVLLVAQPCPEHSWLNAVVQPIVVLGMLVNDRRIAFVGIAGGIAALVLLSPPALQRKLKRASLLLAPVIALYVGVGWFVDSPVFGPVATLRSVITQDDDSSKQVSESELQAEFSTLLLAGHETTARALSWCLYLLSQHAEIAHKAAFEANQALSGRTPTFGDLGNLEYTHWVVQEALRLYPSVYAFSRRAERDDTVCGYRVPKGTKILVSPFVLHRLPDIWPNPDEFQPERFSPEQSNNRSPHAYIPFGAGPRQCIGRRFAMLEMRLIVPMILQRFQLECTSPIPVLPAALGTLTPQSPIHFRLTHRFSAYN